MTMKIFWTTQRLVGYLLAVHLKESSELKRMYSCTKRQELEIRWAFSEDKWLLQFAASEISTKIWTQILLTLQGKGWLTIILSEKVFDFPNTSNPCFEENAWDFWKWDFCCWQPVTRGTTGSSGSLSCGAREVRSPCAWRGGAHYLLWVDPSSVALRSLSQLYLNGACGQAVARNTVYSN